MKYLIAPILLYCIASSILADNIDNEYKFVDLGLSVKWADRNVGSTSPEQYGSYFAWGEVAPKDVYYWASYIHCNGSSFTITKYNLQLHYGNTIDHRIILEKVDDAAQINCGKEWRIPTKEEWEELEKNCNWTWTLMNNTYGYHINSKKNGNTIFLPAAGFQYADNIKSINSYGYYWSSSLDQKSSCDAWFIQFNKSKIKINSDSRDCGQSIRAVIP